MTGTTDLVEAVVLAEHASVGYNDALRRVLGQTGRRPLPARPVGRWCVGQRAQAYRPISRSTWCGLRPSSRRDAAMLVDPASRSRLIAILRKLAMA